MSNYLSYKQIFQDRIKFRQAGTAGGSDFNNYDFPGALYFRILFHFYNTPGTVAGHDSNGFGLLHPTWQVWEPGAENLWERQINHSQRAPEYVPWRYNTAYSYLIMNDEQERAQYLKHFITLLSNINSESPWYFKSIKGIEEAVNRKQFTETFDFKDRGRLTIECMPDAFDQRIATLLDLYRAATYSWTNKREIIPANLRKFDMTVVVFQLPIQGMHIPDGLSSNSFSRGVPNILGRISNLASESDTNFATMDYSQSGPAQASYKVYEFHNCEFDYNSTVAAGEGITNEEPFNTTYNIVILYDNMYESRYNQFLTFDPVKISISNRNQVKLTPYEIENQMMMEKTRQAEIKKLASEIAGNEANKSSRTALLEAKIAEKQKEIAALKEGANSAKKAATELKQTKAKSAKANNQQPNNQQPNASAYSATQAAQAARVARWTRSSNANNQQPKAPATQPTLSEQSAAIFKAAQKKSSAPTGTLSEQSNSIFTTKK